MPFTERDAERHNEKLKDMPRRRRQWVAVANGVLKKCMDEGGTDATCAPQAIRQANGVVQGNELMDNYRTPAGNYEVRKEQLHGQEYLVVPVIMMKEGVHHGSHGPILHRTEDLGEIIESWNGIPVTVQHPQVDGRNTSANHPEVSEEYEVGRVYHSRMDGDRLRAEAWLNRVRLTQVAPDVLEHLLGGKPLDVSIGVFTDDEYSSGEWNGEHYEAIARKHRPDHLALLPGANGACSWADGCGVRANQDGSVKYKCPKCNSVYGPRSAPFKGELKVCSLCEGGNNLETNVGRLKYNGTESTAWTAPTLADFGVDGQWAALSQTDKAMIAAHFLIGAATAASFGDLKLPVVNPRTGKLNENALNAVIGGRGAAVNADAGERSRARRMAYRLLNSEFDRGLDVPQNLRDCKTIDEWAKRLAAQGLAVNEMGYREIGSKIQSKLDAMDSDTKVHYLEDCFDGYFVYRVEQRPSGPSMGGQLFKRTYTMAANGDIEFTGEAQPVVKKVEYVTQEEQKSKEGRENMADKKCCQEKIQALIESEFYTEDDRELLEAMDEAAIDMLTAGAEKATGDITALEEKVTALETNKKEGKQEPVQVNRETVLKVLKEKPLTREEFAGLLSAEDQASIAYGEKLMTQERQRLVDGIVANTGGALEKEYLEAKSLEELQTLAKIPGQADYSANGPVVKTNKDDNRSQILLPPGVKREE